MNKQDFDIIKVKILLKLIIFFAGLLYPDIALVLEQEWRMQESCRISTPHKSQGNKDEHDILSWL